MDTETKISPLIENMFPAFYKEYGESFIMFVKAYYEWLEQNHQLLTLEDNTNFNIGDTITQENVTGTIIAYEGENIIVLVDDFETFKCYNVCNELIPATSSSGGNTYILRGGTTRRLGSIFLSRNLLKMRDIDSTIDLFVLRFKEKYLKNIEFDIKTNKPLLIKNALDLYRAKGTTRAVDLFFRLIYGVGASVYSPGEAVFRLSDAEWVKPQYLEITGTRRSIELVGKQIRGRTSGATAFVEKYIKRKIKDGIIHALYLSNVKGTFVNREILESDTYYDDLPVVVGSLTSVEIITGSSSFEVGDLITFESLRGDQATGRVAATSSDTGVVDLSLLDGGYGYTVSGDPSFTEQELKKRTQSIVSEKVLVLGNVVTSNTVDYIAINSGGSGYNNTDVITVYSNYTNAVANPLTDASGSIISINISNTGSGFYQSNVSVNITNSTGGNTTGLNANLVAVTKEQPNYFNYFETVVQDLYNLEYDSATNNELFIPGQQVYIGNSSVNTAIGVILSNANNTLANANGILRIAVLSNGTVGAGNTVYLTVNSAVSANIANVDYDSATASVMGIPNTAFLVVGDVVNGTFNRDDEVYQINTSGIETGNARVVSTSLTTTAGSLNVNQLKGVITSGRALRVRGRTTTANVINVSLNVGVYDIVNDYTNTFSVPVWSRATGTVANVTSISQGSGASFKVGEIGETEFVYLNTDFLGGNNYPSAGANQAFMTVPISALEYGFPQNPQGNSDAIIFSCLNFDNFEIGTIASLTSVNPGNDYNVQPFIMAYQPYLAGFDFRDYIMKIENANGAFTVGERILQTNTTFETYSLVVDNEVGYVVGEKVYQGTSPSETATGIISSIITTANTIVVRNVTGTFNDSEALYSYISPALNAQVLSVDMNTQTSTARGIVKYADSSTLYVKRIQFDNLFTIGSQIQGSQSRSTANIVSIVESNELPIGLNAQFSANVVTANGTVTSIQITDSGIGYSNGEIMLFISEDGMRAGEAKAIVSGLGTGSGYYRTTKGFLSSSSKLHDGDYYQEYSYEVLTRIPLNTYADMFKKVIHTAGTRFFGGVLIEDVLNMDIVDIQAENVQSLIETAQFNSNTSVVNGAIVINNSYANTELKFKSTDRVMYYTSGSNTAVQPLANNAYYYIANASATQVHLQTNPRILTYTFNGKNDVASDLISIPRHNFVNNDVVVYTTDSGNTAIGGLANNGIYHVVSANSLGIKLAETREGSALSLTPSTVSEEGHHLTITRINIVANSTSSGASTNGHFIVHANEL